MYLIIVQLFRIELCISLSCKFLDFSEELYISVYDSVKQERKMKYKKINLCELQSVYEKLIMFVLGGRELLLLLMRKC